ncbi:HNH endonuclease signature motif containing protein [Mycobacterium spongiae]|uniref:DUF222 domain-containing protein n=1 Tax=Mycobacterium spongiae TaxID=886343 RepID=A0A975K069_9MYCO|nr:HNH endonuclease signature motif containing protein [Mycobacterium spongiae]QUR68269.1 DUF222 domain-containing protein [Mycobacterium spongiae]
MSSSSREEILAVLDALEDDLDRACGLSFDALTTPERLTLLERVETLRRRLPVVEHELINQIGEQASATELGATLPRTLADRLHITRSDASRRITAAADLGPRRALTGQPLAPLLTATAQAQRDGLLGDGHVRVIREFLGRLPTTVDANTREHAEAHLAALATGFRPDELAKLAQRLLDYLHPDGDYTDEHRARRRGLSLGNQDIDGMSKLTGWLTPEARATLEAVLAKLAAPGMCNPDDQTPVIDGVAAHPVIERDARSTGQRNHDGLTAALRALLASGELGQHNGLPATIVVSTTLKDLESATGTALTGGGSLLPMTDVIRLARHAHHYLAIFDQGKAIGLYHTKRLASPGQRIVLYAKDRGCTRPGCDVPGYLCEVHHLTPYAACRTTDVNDLTFACGQDHPLAEKGWTTRKRANGDTEWIPPPHLDSSVLRGQPRINGYHHPERLLTDGGEPEAS